VFPLWAGATTVLLDESSPPLPAAAAASSATVLFCVPTMYRLLLRQPDFGTYDFSSLRCAVSAAEPLPAEVADQWRARTGVDLLDGIGTTELAHIFISCTQGNVRPGLLGRPVAGYDACILDDHFDQAPRGTPGLLAVKGPTGCRYWCDPDAQRAKVRRGWTLTGDVCVQHEDGWFEHVRRSDDLIVSGGYKISRAEVERVLCEHPAVARARVYPVAEPVRGAVPRADVVVRGEPIQAGLVEELQRFLKREIASYKCPREMRILQG
jgi:2-aminobenzoate-CoA ligase